MIDFHTNWLVQYLAQDEELPEIRKACELIEEYAQKEHYPSKTRRLLEWSPDADEIFTLVNKVFVECLKAHQHTYQALIGLVAGSIGCSDPLDRAKCATEVIALCAHAGLVVIEQKVAGYVVYTLFLLDDEIPDIDRHQPLTVQPKLKLTNQILGGRLKQHDRDTCLEHINRMNKIPFALNIDLLRKMDERPTFNLDTPEKKEQWENFISKSYDAYVALAKGENTFWLEHSYDTRGRCYCEGYYLNYQGSSFKKAACQLANKEIVEL